jgi:arylsulfatase A-like enzyme
LDRFIAPGRVSRSAIPDYQWLGLTEFASYQDGYDEEILQTDHSLGTLIEHLRKVQARPTVLVFVADHGEAFGEHGAYFRHGYSLHEEEVRVPLVVELIPGDGSLAGVRPSRPSKWGKGFPAGGRERTPVSTVDLVPTLLEMAGISSNLAFDGIPLAERVGTGAAVFSGWRPGEVAAWAGTAKVILGNRLKTDPGGVEWYDLGRDPDERHPSRGVSDDTRLAEAARAVIEGDPLALLGESGSTDAAFDNLTPEELRRLKSLGYVE